MVGRTVERPHSGGVPLCVRRGTSMGSGQCGAAASTEIELLRIRGGSFVRFGIAHVFIRLLPVLFLAVENRRL